MKYWLRVLFTPSLWFRNGRLVLRLSDQIINQLEENAAKKAEAEALDAAYNTLIECISVESIDPETWSYANLKWLGRKKAVVESYLDVADHDLRCEVWSEALFDYHRTNNLFAKLSWGSDTTVQDAIVNYLDKYLDESLTPRVLEYREELLRDME